jgi:hypothetical protein
MRSLTIYLLLPLLVGDGGSYKHVGGASGVEVYRQMRSPVIDLLAEGEFDAPPARVLAILLDYANASAVSERVAESRVLQSSERHLVVYQRLRLPVIADRDFTLRVLHGARGETLWMRFFVDNTRGPTAIKGRTILVEDVQWCH